MEFEKFIDQVKKTHKSQSGSLRITIPYKIAQYAGIKKGDYVKVMIKKIQKKEAKK